MCSLLVHCCGGGADSGLVAHGVAEEEDGGVVGGMVQGVQGVQGLVAHGVADVEEGALFLTPNLTVVEAHTGSSASLDCTVARGSDHGMVSSEDPEKNLTWSPQISWFLKRGASPLVLLTVGDEVYIQDYRVALHRPVLSMVCCKH